jgi:hypothetical protein
MIVERRLLRWRFSVPENQRLVPVPPNIRRSPARRSEFLRNLQAQFWGIEHSARGSRGAARIKKRCPAALFAARQQTPVEQIATARKSFPGLDALRSASAAAFFGAFSAGRFVSIRRSDLIMFLFP